MSNEIQKNVRDKVSLKEEMYMKHDTESLTLVIKSLNELKTD